MSHLRLRVVYDQTGRILSAQQLAEGEERQMNMPHMREGQQMAIVSVPATHAHLDFIGVCTMMKIDTTTPRPLLMAIPEHHGAGPKDSPQRQE